MDATRYPSLAILIARANVGRLLSNSREESLFALCGSSFIDSSVPSVAALTALVDCSQNDPAGLMRIDPVHLRADPNQILLFNSAALAPSIDEADSLIETLNREIPELCIYRGHHPARWYFNLDPMHCVTTCSPYSASGRSIADFLPRGAFAPELAQLINEAQMVLHGAPVNLAREAEGKPAINSLWPWGGGSVEELEIRQPESKQPELLVGNDAVLCGIGKHLDIDWLASSSIEQLCGEFSARPAHILCALGSPNGAIEGEEQIVSVDEFEQQWAGPIVRLLRRFKIESVRIAADRKSYDLNPRDIYKIWRQPRPNIGALDV